MCTQVTTDKSITIGRYSSSASKYVYSKTYWLFTAHIHVSILAMAETTAATAVLSRDDDVFCTLMQLKLFPCFASGLHMWILFVFLYLLLLRYTGKLKNSVSDAISTQSKPLATEIYFVKNKPWRSVFGMKRLDFSSFGSLFIKPPLKNSRILLS